MKIDRPTVAEVLPLARAIFDRPDGTGSMGCCLHIVLDDDNVKDRDVAFCVGFATEKGHDDCLRVANLLVQMTRSQRSRVGELI